MEKLILYYVCESVYKNSSFEVYVMMTGLFMLRIYSSKNNMIYHKKR